MQEYKDWDGNLLPDPAPRICNIHIGDTIKIKINDEDRIGRASKYCEYEVIGVYPRNVLTRDKKDRIPPELFLRRSPDNGIREPGSGNRDHA